MLFVCVVLGFILMVNMNILLRFVVIGLSWGFKFCGNLVCVVDKCLLISWWVK